MGENERIKRNLIMKKSLSMRTQLIIMMNMLVVFLGIALAVSLRLSNVFVLLDEESFRHFENATETKQLILDDELGNLVQNLTIKSKEMSAIIEQELEYSALGPKQIYQNDSLYQNISVASGQRLIELLNNTNVSGAFIFFEGSNADKDSDIRHSAVFIRDSAPENKAASKGKFMMELGTVQVSKQNAIPISINWDLDFAFDDQHPNAYDFYYKPIEAALSFPGSEVERFGYWTPPFALLKDNQQSLHYSLPIVGEKGEVYGLIGVEIAVPYFLNYYLPGTERPFPNSFFTLVDIDEDQNKIHWFLPLRDLAKENFQSTHPGIELKPVGGQAIDDIYSTNLMRQGKSYVNLKKVTMYSKNSPYQSNSWYVAGFVPESNLYQSSSNVRFALYIGITLAFVIAGIAILLIAYFFTRKISGLSAYVQGLSPKSDVHFHKTGLLEIDELTGALEKFNEKVIESSKTTARILEMTDLPLGGYEIVLGANQVTLTDYISNLMGIEPGTKISLLEWEGFYRKLTAIPQEGYDNVYRKDGNIKELFQWFRIMETPTNNGFIGIILDVTKEVQENLRLTHFLDYDALTQLYNRNAYNREVTKLIEEEPNAIGACIFCDLDSLKFINDTFGHDTGDRYIISAGEMFRKLGYYGGVVSRVSGDEFALYLHGFKSEEDCRRVIYEFFETNKTQVMTDDKGGTHAIRFSTGISWYPRDARDIVQLLKQADFAMYEVKKNNKGSIAEFNRVTYLENLYLLDNREAINRLIDEELIHFAFQPIVSAKNGQVVAYEALMRPLLEDFDSPMQILNVAAAQSKLNQLERMIILKVFRTIHERFDEFNGVDIFINSIANQTLHPEDIEYIRINYSHIMPKIVVEITEGRDNNEINRENKISTLRGLGLRLALDDFGKGYSNELRILDYSPDIIKIDMELVQGIHYSIDKEKLVRNLIAFCHSKGIKVIAEGIESKKDIIKLMELDIDWLQGYYLAKPDFVIRNTKKMKEQVLQIHQEILEDHESYPKIYKY